jgi:murein DD-endopeptidase MepM/ murein hydrolase activator NlpD
MIVLLLGFNLEGASFKVYKKEKLIEGTVLTEAVDVIAKNDAYGPITITLNIKDKCNLRESDMKSLTTVVPVGKSITLASFEVKNKKQKYELDYSFSCKWGDLSADKNHGHIYMLPFPDGATAEVIQGFGGKLSHHGVYHYAVDFIMPEGTPITAAREGAVISVKVDSSVGGPSEEFKNLANVIQVMHDDGTIASYGHLEFKGKLVAEGDRIEIGEIIGFSGHTGFSTSPHLDFYVYKPISGSEISSLPIRFKTAQGIIDEPKVGESYTSFSGSR